MFETTFPKEMPRPPEKPRSPEKPRPPEKPIVTGVEICAGVECALLTQVVSFNPTFNSLENSIIPFSYQC